MRKPILWTCLVTLFCTGLAVADPVPFEINGELRVRNENDNRDFNSDTGYKSFNLMRTRLGVNVQPAQDMKVVVQVQDSRVQGVTTTSTVPGVQEDTKLDLHQGFFEVDNLGRPGLGVKAGRMQVRFGNERLIGVNDWDNVSQVFDGVMAKVDGERVQVQGLFANLVEMDTPTIGTPDSENNSDKTLQALFGTVGVYDHASADLFLINTRDKVTTDENDDINVLTLGTRVHGYTPSRVDYSVEAAYQTGTMEIDASTKNDIAAYMFGGEVGVTIGNEEKPVRFGAGFDYLSGDDNPADNDLKMFDTLFADNHRFYGAMDIVDPTATSAGLQDVKVNVRGTVYKDVNSSVQLGAEFHNFRLAQAAGGESALGNEVDVHASWAYRERFVPTLGISAFIPGQVITGPTPGADNSYWVYAQGVVSF